MGADIREMLCADALAITRSSLSLLTVAHSRASVFFVPDQCGNGRFKRMQNPPVKAAFDNTTLLVLERPHAEVGRVHGTATGGAGGEAKSIPHSHLGGRSLPPSVDFPPVSEL